MTVLELHEDIREVRNYKRSCFYVAGYVMVPYLHPFRTCSE